MTDETTYEWIKFLKNIGKITFFLIWFPLSFWGLGGYFALCYHIFMIGWNAVLLTLK